MNDVLKRMEYAESASFLSAPRQFQPVTRSSQVNSFLLIIKDSVKRHQCRYCMLFEIKRLSKRCKVVNVWA